MIKPLDEYMTTQEAALEIGIPYSRLMARIRKGKIPSIKKGWTTLIHRNEVKKAKLKENKHAAIKESLEKPTR